MRKLVSIRKVSKLEPIKKADLIECATVDGWKTVVKKGEFKEGDLGLYFEVDSFIPHELYPDLSKGRDPILFEGILGQYLKTVRLRGQLSQGLLLPLSVGLSLPNSSHVFKKSEAELLGMDVSEVFNVVKWEPPIPEELLGAVKPFPSLVPKTDVDRIQNLVEDLEIWKSNGSLWSISEKVDGTSMTVYNMPEDQGVCGKTWAFLDSVNNLYTRTEKSHGLLNKLISNNLNVALQGELVGPGVKGLKYGLTSSEFLLFKVYDIKNGRYLREDDLKAIAHELGVRTVPLMEYSPKTLENATIEDLLLNATGISKLNPDVMREGLVYSNADENVSFKVISNEFLLKHS